MFIFLAGHYFANLKTKQRVTDQCQDRPYMLQYLSNFSKNSFHSLQSHGHSVSYDFVQCVLKLKTIIKNLHG